jgi:hypothetical protein
MQNNACLWMLMLALPLVGCGKEAGDGASPASPAASMAVARQSAPGPRWLDAQAIPSKELAPPAPFGSTGTAEAVLDPARLAQLNALPHLSDLNPREKAGLLLLLPPMSPAERLVLINMYPSLVKLPLPQKQILLDKLEKIVPRTTP